MTSSRKQPPPSTGTRELMLGWCLWLLGSWGVTLSRVSPVPGVRWMIFAALVGLMLVWPAFRLSQARQGPVGSGSASVLLMLVDWVCLLVIFQAVVWPLKVVAGWPLEQVAWLDGAVVAWTLLTAAITAGGRLFGGGLARTLAMAACVLLLLGEPVVMAVSGAGGGGRWAMRVSPVWAIWELTQPAVNAHVDAVRASVATALVAAGCAWGAVILLTLTVRFHGRDEAGVHEAARPVPPE